jgi:sodium/potassium-transporting ATPase subunit alpha
MQLSTVHATPEGPTLFCKGAPEMVVPLCDRILADGEIRPFDSGLRTKVRQAQETMAGQGLRVIAMSYRPLEDHGERAKVERKISSSPDWPDSKIRPVPRCRRRCANAARPVSP